MPPDACFLQAALMEAGDGDYLEVGVYNGDSLLFAGLVKRALGHTGKLYGIDIDETKQMLIEETLAFHNIEAEVVYKSSNPWPLPDVRPVVCYIDGSHSYDGVSADWNNLKGRAGKFIVMHDYTSNEHVTKFIDGLIKAPDPNWRFCGYSRYTVVWERNVGQEYRGRFREE